MPDEATIKSRFTDEQIIDIRGKRALKNEAGDGPAHTHKALAEMFGTSAGVISQIVRNITYKDPEYTPVNDTPAA